VIRLVDRTVADSVVTGVELGIDPGSKATGISVFLPTPDGRVGLVSFEVCHRGQQIHKKMGQRAGYRRRRRSANLRYRAPRFDNRSRPKSWLAPSLRHRVDTTMSMVDRLRRSAPVIAIHQELVCFDTQKMDNPEVSGAEYQQGTLAGYEVREYLLAKFGRACAYCGATSTPLNIDHICPRSSGGTNRVANLALACVACNSDKSNLELRAWLSLRFGSDAEAIATRVLARAKSPLTDAAAVNTTRWALYEALQSTGLPVSTGSGGRTKWNRSRFSVAKSHSLDAICVGEVGGVVSVPATVIVAKATGRGSYARTRPDGFGFPRLRLPRAKSIHGFTTGDLVRAVVSKGKHAGVHVGRVVVRTRGSFVISTRAGKVETSYSNCRILQRGDGWTWSRQREEALDAA
jgi:5-methylcytosine-specific restriction endonuclease McrA